MTKPAHCLVVFLLVVALFAAAQSPAPDIFKRPEHFERSRDYDALHYKLAFSFDVPRKTVYGRNTVTLASLRDDLARLVLDAVDLDVTAVTDAAGAPLKFERTPAELVVLPARVLAYGETTTFTVAYTVRDPKAGVKFLAGTADYPAQINTYNWPEDARRWIPCYDEPDDKATDELIATVPAADSVLSNGRLVEVTEDKAAGTRTFHWSQDKPLPTYNIMMAVGPFEIVRDRLGGLPVDYWVARKDVPEARVSFRKTPRMIDFYDKTFGVDYPWAKYDQICYAGYGGGMEATSATMLGRSTLHDERADKDYPSDGLVAHELAHQWWGDLVTERDWADVWLSESFATYSEYLWTRFDLGEDESALNLLDKKNEYLREAHTRYMRPVVFNRWNNPWDVMDGHSYPKGAAILHMLRFVMGDGPFFWALNRYLTTFAYGNADTRDLMRTIKDATGQNLDWFFDQWIYRAGHPVFEVSWAWDEAAATATVRVVQTQDPVKTVDAYRTPVVIGFILPDGRAAAERVWIEKRDQSFAFPASRKPLLLEFDKGHWLLMEAKVARSLDELLFKLKADDAVGRLEAAGDLGGRLAEPGVAAALVERAKADPFWAVRKAALESLAKGGAGSAAANGAAARLSLLKDACLDPSSKVRAAAVRLLGDLRDRRLVPFLEERFAKDDSYAAQSEALAAIGKSGDAAAAGFLKAAAGTPSPWDMLRRRAEAALKALGAAAPDKE